MQIILKLKPMQPLSVPFNYQYQMQSAVYAKLAEIDASDFWHDSGFGDSKKFKAFNFGPLKGKYTVKDNKLHFSDYVYFELRSPVFSFCDDFQRAIELNPQMKLFNTFLKVENASVTNVHINSRTAVFRTETPILIYTSTEDGKTLYYTPEDDEFYIGICNNFAAKFEAVCNAPAEEVRIRPIVSEKTNRFKKVVTRYKSTWLTAYHGIFEVQASPFSLEFMYNTGMGAKNSQGFGFLRIL